MKYCARLRIGNGGSWARGDTPDAAALKCLRIAQADWNGLYAIPDDTPIPVYMDSGTGNFDDDVFFKAIVVTK